MPVVQHSVDLGEGYCGCHGVPFGVGADGQYGYTLGIAAKVLHHRTQLLGGQRAGIGTVGIEKGQDDRLALELRKGDGLAKLVGEVKIWSRRTSKVRSLQARCIACWRKVTGGVRG